MNNVHVEMAKLHEENIGNQSCKQVDTKKEDLLKNLLIPQIIGRSSCIFT